MNLTRIKSVVDSTHLLVNTSSFFFIIWTEFPMALFFLSWHLIFLTTDDVTRNGQ